MRFLLIFLLLSTSVPAQQPPASMATPRATLESFMTTMGQAGALRPDLYITARQYLDLSVFPVLVREEKGIAAAQELYEILLAIDADPEDLPDDPDQLMVSLYRQPSGDEVVLIRDDSGAWRFSAETVASLPRMRAVLAEKGKIIAWVVPPWLEFSFLGLSGIQWTALLLLPLVSWAIGRVWVLFIRRLVRRWLESEAFGIHVDEQRRVLRPLGWMAGSLVFWAGLSAIHLPDAVLVVLAVIVKLVGAFSAVLSAYRAADVLALYCHHLASQTDTRYDDMLVPLVRRTVKVIVTIVGVLFVSQNLNINVWSLFAGFSVVGAMVALAGQDLVKNFFGSVTVLLDRPFSVGDWVVMAGVEGTVEDVGFRSTRVRTFYDSLVTVPNSSLITANVDNYGARRYRRYTTRLNILLSTDPEAIEAFCEGMRELVRQHPYTRKDYYHIYVNDVSEYSLQVLLYVFWDAPDWATELRERHRLLVDIHRLARRLGVEFAYPTSQVWLNQERPAPDEDDRFDLDAANRGLERGQEQGRSLVQAVLPPGSEKPPPVVVE